MRQRYKFILLLLACAFMFTLFLHGALAQPHRLGQSMGAGLVQDEPGSLAEGILSSSARKAIEWFQEVISPIDAGRCQMYPTCSEYARQAIARHGILVGLVMTFERLLHEYDEPRFVPRIVVDGRARYYDPVSANDFWCSPAEK